MVDERQCASVVTSLSKFGWNSQLWVVLFLLAGLSPSISGAEIESERIDRIKVAFVLNIARFVTWPPEALQHQSNELLLCLYQSNPYDQAISTIAGKMVNGRSLQIKRVASMKQSGPCHILLIGGNEIQNFADDSDKDPNRPLLSIADLTNNGALPAQQHALVSLVRNGARIGFEIDLAKARKVGLQMSANLLKLAKIVGTGN